MTVCPYGYVLLNGHLMLCVCVWILFFNVSFKSYGLVIFFIRFFQRPQRDLFMEWTPSWTPSGKFGPIFWMLLELMVFFLLCMVIYFNLEEIMMILKVVYRMIIVSPRSLSQKWDWHFLHLGLLQLKKKSIQLQRNHLQQRLDSVKTGLLCK